MKDELILTREGFNLEIHAHNIVQSAQKLLILTSDLKQSNLLNDFDSMRKSMEKRAELLKETQKEILMELNLLEDNLAKGIYDLESAYFSNSSVDTMPSVS